MLCAFRFVLVLALSFVVSGAARADSSEDVYGNYQSKVTLLYRNMVLLDQKIRDGRLSVKVQKYRLMRNTAIAIKYCSDGYESQMFFQSQGGKESQSDTDQYSQDLNSRRTEVYDMCSRVKSMSTDLSLYVKTGGAPRHKAASSSLAYEKMYKNVRSKYRTMVAVARLVTRVGAEKSAKMNVVKKNQDLMKFQCNYGTEKTLYERTKRKILEEAAATRRSLASTPITSWANRKERLDQLQKRHWLFGKMCSQLQHKQDSVNKFLRSNLYK